MTSDDPDARLEFRDPPGEARLLARVAQTRGGCPAALFVMMAQPAGFAPRYVRVATRADLAALPQGPLPDLPPRTLFRLSEASVPLGDGPAGDPVAVAGAIRAAVAALCGRLGREESRPSWSVWARGGDA